MCDQCLSDAIKLGEVVPGWILFYTRKNGHFVDAGMYCLGREHADAAVAWPPEAFISDAITTKFISGLVMPPEEGHSLLEACLSGGYDPKRAASDDLKGVFIFWLYHRLRGMIGKNPVHRE